MTLPARLHYQVRDESFSQPRDRIRVRETPEGGAEIYSGPVSRFLPPDASDYAVNQALNDVVRLRVSRMVPREGQRLPAAYFPPFVAPEDEG